MANLKAAKKSIRSDKKKTVFNARVKRAMKESVKSIKDLIKKDQVQDAEKSLPTAYKAIDKAVKRGVIKKNTASRKKSRLVSEIKKAK